MPRKSESFLSVHKISLGVSVITMIGYGDIVPRTKWGKIGVIIYACLGIPVYILYFTNIGKVFARILKWLYTKAYRQVLCMNVEQIELQQIDS